MSKIYTLTAAEISDKVCELALTANMYLPEDVAESLRKARAAEKLGRAQSLYDEIIENAKLAADKYMPICQDCGMAVLFIELGQDLHVEGGDLEEAVNEGVRRAYREGYLRKSVVRDPLADRRNTGDNTPAVIHWKIVPGNAIDITITPKGMGSENMSRIFMLKPADGAEGVVRSVVETVRRDGARGRLQPLPADSHRRRHRRQLRDRAARRERGAARPLRRPQPDRILREARRRNPARSQQIRHRPVGLRRHGHGARRAHRDEADAHRGNAGRRQYLLPRAAPRARTHRRERLRT